jgi:hypothetical protein
MNVVAVRNLGLLAQASGDLETARKDMDVARSLTRRDLWTDAWIANDRALSNQIPQALRSYDEALRSSARAQTLLLPVLLQNLKNDALVQPVITLLKQRPPWQIEFWGEAPHYADSLLNLARIRDAVAESGIEIPRNYDKTLVAELANHRHFVEAEKLNSELSGKNKKTGSEVLYNAHFDQQAGFEPFDWQFFFDSNLSADLRTSAGVLQISTFSDGGGAVARQLVSLPGDVYTLSARAKQWNRLDQNSFYFRLDCAEVQEPATSRPIWLDRADLNVTFRKPQAGCRYYWLTLFAVPQRSREDNVLTLEDISLLPAKSANSQ